MKNLINQVLAAKIVLIILALTVVFHVFVLASIIPSDLVWGGRLANEAEVIQNEWISIILNILMIVLVRFRLQHIKTSFHHSFMLFLMYMMMVVFSLNSLGNILSSNTFETFVFAPITLILALLSFRLAQKE